MQVNKKVNATQKFFHPIVILGMTIIAPSLSSKVIEFLYSYKGSSKITKQKTTNQRKNQNYFCVLMTCLRQQLCLKVKNAFENKVVAISDLAVKIIYIPNNISYILGGDAHDLIQIFQQRMFLFLGGTLSYLTENLLLPVFTKLKSN